MGNKKMSGVIGAITSGFFADWDGFARHTDAPGARFTAEVKDGTVTIRRTDSGMPVHEAAVYATMKDLNKAVGSELTLLKEFTLFWLHGDRNVIMGESIESAMNNFGYGGGSIRALDFYAEGDNQEYQFVREGGERGRGSWQRIEPLIKVA